MEKISWTDQVRNEVLRRIEEQRNILHEIINGSLTGLVTFCVETAFYGRLLKENKQRDRSDRKTRKKPYEATG
jgi:hypothetical protein